MSSNENSQRPSDIEGTLPEATPRQRSRRIPVKRRSHTRDALRTQMLQEREALSQIHTPLLDNLRKVDLPKLPGLETAEDLLLHMLSHIKRDRKVVVGVIAPSGTGKTSIVTSLVTKLEDPTVARAVGKDVSVGVVASESALDAGKKEELGIDESRRIKQLIHGIYTPEEYNVGSAILQRGVELALEHHNIVLLDTPGTTGARFGDRQYGKNRGASALEALASRYSSQQEDTTLFIVGVVPSVERQKIILFSRMELDYKSAPEQTRTLRRHGIYVSISDASERTPGASSTGTEAINYETNEALLEMAEDRIIFARLKDRIRLRGLDPHKLNGRPNLRIALLSEYYAEFFKNLNLSYDTIFIAVNDWLQEFNLDFDLLEQRDFILYLEKAGRLWELNPFI